MATTPAEYIAAIEEFLLSNVGIASISHPDGRNLSLDRKQALQELTYWQNQQRVTDNTPYKIGTKRLGLKGDA